MEVDINLAGASIMDKYFAAAFAASVAILIQVTPAWGEQTAALPEKSTSLLVSFSAPPEELGKVPLSLSSALGRTDLDATTLTRLSKLGSPLKIESMIRDRVPEGMLDKLPALHPERLLHNVVVVTYASAVAAEIQLAFLIGDPTVLNAGLNHRVDPHFWPSWEPYYSDWYPAERDYQWGMLALRTYDAWDVTYGWGYVGVVDTGIAPSHEEFVSSFARQFAVNHTVPIGDPSRNNVDEERNPPINQRKGHGTHVAGIIAAKGWNQAGVAGVCMECVLLVQKYYSPSDLPSPNGFLGGTKDDIVNGINKAIRSGAQVVNLSLGSDIETRIQCAGSPMDPWCLVADYARRRHVNLVASAGNANSGILQMPAFIDEYLPVGGLMVYSPAAASNYLFWKPWLGTWGGTNFSALQPEKVVMAAASDVVSSMYPGADWYADARCGSTFHGGLDIPGYGLCTGTSMAAPHITGMLAVMRSINPLKTDAEVRQALLNSTSVPDFGTWPYSDSNLYSASEKDPLRWGKGVPNMRTAVDSMVAGNPSRLTPLFSMYGAGPENYFYTAVPQMAVAATQGGVLPNSATFWWDLYSPVGSPINEYPSFPDVADTPGAQMWVFTTPQNPKNPATSLAPLYRFSWRCAACQNPNHVDHSYTTMVAEFSNFFAGGNLYDGLEGYIYPSSEPQYAGTEAVYRSYNSSRLDYAIYPASSYAAMLAEGYTEYLTHLGWAYPNTGPRPTIQ